MNRTTRTAAFARSFALCALCALIALAACAAASRPALDHPFYDVYRGAGAKVTAVREGYLIRHLDRRRGANFECFPPRGGQFVAGLGFGTGAFSAGTEFVRRIEPGETGRVKELRYYEGLPGVWAEIAWDAGGPACIAPAAQGLKLHLLFTDAELSEWNRVPEDIRALIVSRQIRPGMQRAQVLIAWGEPYKQIQQTTPDGTFETWVYQKGENRLVYLEFHGETLRLVRE